MIHTVDDDGELYRVFREWGNKIVDLDGDKKFAAYYLKDYAVQMALRIYKRNAEDAAKTVIFKEAFPMSVEPIQLSWGQHDEIARLSVSYRFTRFEVL